MFTPPCVNGTCTYGDERYNSLTVSANKSLYLFCSWQWFITFTTHLVQSFLSTHIIHMSHTHTSHTHTSHTHITHSWRNMSKYSRLVPLGVVGSLLASGAISLGFLIISMHNYPGGNAFRIFHQLARGKRCGAIGTQGVGGEKEFPWLLCVCK